MCNSDKIIFHTIKILKIALIQTVLIHHIYAREIQFSHITTDNGLTNCNIWCVTKDYQGFIWIATEDGLHRYDGYAMKVYKNDKSDSTSISSNFILRLYEDSFKNLWIGTLDGGLCRYDREKDFFYVYKNDPADSFSIHDNAVFSLYEDSNKTLYIGSNALSTIKLQETLPAKIKFNNYHFPVDNGKILKNNWGSSIIEDKNGNILISENGGGISVFNPKTQTIRKFLVNEIDNRIQTIFIDDHNRLWEGTWGSGILLYDLNDVSDDRHKKPIAILNDICPTQIEVITSDNDGNIWIATDEGLCLLPKGRSPFNKQSFLKYTHNDLDPASLLGNSIKSLYIDHDNRLWAGSYFAGLNVYDRESIKFRTVHKKAWRPENSLSHNNVTSFAMDKDENLWIGTDGGGLNRLKGPENVFTDLYEHIELHNKKLKVKCLDTDSHGNVWIGTWGEGLIRYDPKSKTTIRYREGKFMPDKIFSIKTDNKDRVWIGTFRNGVSCYDQRNDTFYHFRAFTNKEKQRYERINTIFIDRENRVWVGKETGGLNLYNLDSLSYTPVENQILTKQSNIITITQDKKGLLWLGSNEGLIRYNPNNGEANLFNSKNGLSNDFIYAILEDEKSQNIWVSTNLGISVFDIESETFMNFNKADGLQSNQFNPNSMIKLDDGQMFFGGVNGFNAFYPDKITLNKSTPSLVFTNLYINNKEVNVREPGSPLKKNIIVADRIDLKHQNSFSIEFASLDFSLNKDNEYKYFLEGFNTGWQINRKDRKAVFTNLNPGTYILHIKASNVDGFWMEKDNSILIKIHPEWWQTLLAKILFVFVFLLSGFLIFRLRLRYHVRQKLALANLVKKRTWELELKNYELGDKIEEINEQNIQLQNQKHEIANQKDEIMAQNEELSTQNEQINLQRRELEITKNKLKKINEELEKLVDKRTRTLKNTIEELDKTVLELDRFVYSASHDLSAPLKSVSGLVKIAQLEDDPARIKECHQHIEQSIARLELVIKSLIEYARNKHMGINITPVNIYGIIEDVYKELSMTTNFTRITFINEIDPKQVIHTDEQRLRIILINIIDNCIKFADTAKPQPSVHLSCRASDHTCVLSIKDNGIGIEEQYLSKIFNMYFRANERSQGSGLGLYIVKETISRLKGKITIKSNLSIGTECKIELPV